MGLFGKSVFDIAKDIVNDSGGYSGSSYRTATTKLPGIAAGSPKDIVDTLEKIGLLFTDVEMEGQKRGYERAAVEYEEAFARIEEEYRETKRVLEAEIYKKGAKVDRLIAKLHELELRRDALKEQVKCQAQQVSKRYNIPLQKVSQAAATGTLIVGGSSFDLLDIICAKKEKKLKEAEERGYREARSEYRKKIDDLKTNLNRLIVKGESELAELTNLIKDVIDEIEREETKIAELKVLMK